VQLGALDDGDELYIDLEAFGATAVPAAVAGALAASLALSPFRTSSPVVCVAVPGVAGLDGVELHAARAHAGATRLAFLKQHFLLASAGAGGVVRWQDVTTGEVVAERATRLGDTRALTVNPWNAVLVAGHGGGTVTMWTPNSAVPVVRMLAHAGPVVAAAFRVSCASPFQHGGRPESNAKSIAPKA
jgi:hypothetical protein